MSTHEKVDAVRYHMDYIAVRDVVVASARKALNASEAEYPLVHVVRKEGVFDLTFINPDKVM